MKSAPAQNCTKLPFWWWGIQPLHANVVQRAGQYTPLFQCVLHGRHPSQMTLCYNESQWQKMNLNESQWHNGSQWITMKNINTRAALPSPTWTTPQADPISQGTWPLTNCTTVWAWGYVQAGSLAEFEPSAHQDSPLRPLSLATAAATAGYVFCRAQRELWWSNHISLYSIVIHCDSWFHCVPLW